MIMLEYRKLELMLIAAVILMMVPAMGEGPAEKIDYSAGVWNNFNFSRPAEDWASAAAFFGGDRGLVDLVVCQENLDGFTYLAFPYPSKGYLLSGSLTDEVEPYLEEFDRQGIKVILSVQPGKVDVARIIEILLNRYGHHECIIGINVDLEWKKTGRENHVSDEERDVWMNAIKRQNQDLKLFLTYFLDHTHFPEDDTDLVILFDGEHASQSELLKRYEDLAMHYESVGIYTGYLSSHPQSASDQRILAAAPNTRYIIHTQDVFPDEKVLIFLMGGVQVDWLEEGSIDLLNLHEEKNVPAVVGVIANNLDNPHVGGGFLPGLLQELHQNKSDLFEIAQYAYSEENGQSYEDLKKSISTGLQTFSRLGIRPVTLIPSLLEADKSTVWVAEELGFEILVASSQSLDADRLEVLNTYVSLTRENGELKGSRELMAEIDGKEQNAVVVLYQIQDFGPASGNRVEELGSILDALKESRRYRFMTGNQYLETLTVASRNLQEMKKQPGWNMPLAVVALYAIRRLISARNIE
jgi:predicted nuclease of predicted toxin-antitoxin system